MIPIEKRDQGIAVGHKRPLADFYTVYYRHEKADSPVQSIISLARRAKSEIEKLGNEAWLLDLGAGRQIFEKNYPWKINCHIVTLDIATLVRKQLLARKTSFHVQGDGTHLPFPDNFFALAISNLALDFMPKEARAELSRVLILESPVYLNLHHPNLKDQDLAFFAQKARERKLSSSGKQVLGHWLDLKNGQSLFWSKEQIEEIFGKHGFQVSRVHEIIDPKGRWWEVDMVKKKGEENDGG